MLTNKETARVGEMLEYFKRLGYTKPMLNLYPTDSKVKEAIVVGQSWDNDVRIILFLIMNKDKKLNENLKNDSKLAIRKQASPRHIPSKILEVSDIPRTKNGKIVELAVKSVIEGNNIKNKEALANPKALEQYKNLKELSY